MQSFSPSLAQILPDFRSLVLVLSSLGLLLIASLIAMRNLPEFGFKVRGYLRLIRLKFVGPRFEAKMSDLNCPQCHKCTGVFDPIFVTVQGIPHFEGNCNSCLHYIRGHVN